MIVCRNCGHEKKYHPWVFCHKGDCRCAGWVELRVEGDEE